MTHDFNETTLIRVPDTYERILIGCLMHCRQAYLTLGQSICPWNGQLGIRRADFAIGRYNLLFEAIAYAYGLCSAASLEEVPRLEQLHLEAIIIDWNNTARIPANTAEKLLQEIREDFYAMPLSQEYIKSILEGDDFRTWQSRAMARRHVSAITGLSRKNHLTFEEIESSVENQKAGIMATAPGSVARAIILHHTAKPLKTNNGGGASLWNSADHSYAGLGSVEWANWARAVMLLQGTADDSVFELMAVKRGKQLGWKDPNGKPTIKSFVAHSLVEHQLYWRTMTAEEVPVAADQDKVEKLILELVPEKETVPQQNVLEDCKNNNILEKAARDAIKKLIKEGKLQFAAVPETAKGPDKLKKYLTRGGENK